MARPPSRSRRTREPAPPPPRRGGRAPAPRRSPGPPPMLVIGAAVVVVGAGIAAMVMAGKEKKEPPKAEPVVLGPVAEKEEFLPPKPPEKVPPPPLTERELSYVRGLFDQAQPHMDRFNELAAEGWKHEDEADRNRLWLEAKEEARTAIAIVSEALEDYDQFPLERQDAHMRPWNNRLGGWQKDLMTKIGKTHK